jgi:predicted ribosomally synthesized peptide with nif11-like leader
MSSEALHAFFAKASEDQELLEKIKAVKTANKERAIAEFVKLGADAGFEFSGDDLRAAEEADVAGQCAPSGDAKTAVIGCIDIFCCCEAVLK